MGTSPYVKGPQKNAVSRVSLIIIGVRTKLENTHAHDLLMKYDMIGLSEVKTNELVSLPCYACYKNIGPRDGHRGVIVFVSRCDEHRLCYEEPSLVQANHCATMVCLCAPRRLTIF